MPFIRGIKKRLQSLKVRFMAGKAIRSADKTSHRFRKRLREKDKDVDQGPIAPIH